MGLLAHEQRACPFCGVVSFLAGGTIPYVTNKIVEGLVVVSSIGYYICSGGWQSSLVHHWLDTLMFRKTVGRDSICEQTLPK
jgi:hypothetical protein